MCITGIAVKDNFKLRSFTVITDIELFGKLCPVSFCERYADIVFTKS